jgi:hypothetical protein
VIIISSPHKHSFFIALKECIRPDIPQQRFKKRVVESNPSSGQVRTPQPDQPTDSPNQLTFATPTVAHLFKIGKPKIYHRMMVTNETGDQEQIFRLFKQTVRNTYIRLETLA